MVGAKGFFETSLVVASWFVLNIMMAASTKYIFVYGEICVGARGCHFYRFPLTITVIHMGFSWFMCRIHLFWIRATPPTTTMSFNHQMQKIAPLAGTFALSVAMGNLSLKYIYPSFNQMLGSMSPLITVLMAVLLEGKRYNSKTWLSMPVICGGLAVCSFKEVNFNWLGAVFCLGATILRSLKSMMQGKLLTEKLDSVTLLYYMAPWAAALLMVMALFLEGAQPVMLLMSGFDFGPVHDGEEGRFGGVPFVVMLLVGSGLNACLLNVSNFLVTAYTGPVTLQVLGNVKSCLSIVISVSIFKNELLFEQGVGVVTCLFGVWIYTNMGGAAKPAGSVSSNSMVAKTEIDLAPLAKEQPATASGSAPTVDIDEEEI